MGYFPTYLYFHPSSYIFRIGVPCNIIPRLGKNEIRCRAKTLSRTLAIQRGIRMYTRAQSIFKGLRGGGRMAELSKRDINAILDWWHKEGNNLLLGFNYRDGVAGSKTFWQRKVNLGVLALRTKP